LIHAAVYSYQPTQSSVTPTWFAISRQCVCVSIHIRDYWWKSNCGRLQQYWSWKYVLHRVLIGENSLNPVCFCSIQCVQLSHPNEVNNTKNPGISISLITVEAWQNQSTYNKNVSCPFQITQKPGISVSLITVEAWQNQSTYKLGGFHIIIIIRGLCPNESIGRAYR